MLPVAAHTVSLQQGASDIQELPPPFHVLVPNIGRIMKY